MGFCTTPRLRSTLVGLVLGSRHGKQQHESPTPRNIPDRNREEGPIGIRCEEISSLENGLEDLYSLLGTDERAGNGCNANKSHAAGIGVRRLELDQPKLALIC